MTIILNDLPEALKDDLNYLIRYVGHGRLDAVIGKLEYLNVALPKHNHSTPSQTYTMADLLNITMGECTRLEWHDDPVVKDLTLLEFAHINKNVEITSALRAAGAPETGRTAWLPGFWNTVNPILNRAPIENRLNPTHDANMRANDNGYDVKRR